MNCSVRMLPPDTAFRIDTRMTADFDINDVRPKGSPALTWYLEVAVGWLPDKQVKHYPTGMVNTFFWVLLHVMLETVLAESALCPPSRREASSRSWQAKPSYRFLLYIDG